MASQSYLIVGGGVFGVSTAYTLIQKYPNASVTIVDRDPYDGDNRVAASWDWNKVVRADYDDLIYCRLALEAQDIFESDPLWMPHFHKAGVFWVCRSDYAQDVINNYKKLGREHDITVYTIEEAKKLYGGLYEEANYDGAKEVLVNRNSGWGAAGDSLRAVTREAMKLGVKYVVADVATLQIENGRATGIQTSKGEIISADTVILSTGAYTAKLLEYSAARHNLPDLRSGDRITAAGITTGMVTLDDESYGRMKDMPVGFQGYTYKHKSPFIGSLPPTKDREIKWWGKNIFSNTRQVLPGRYVSAPPDEKDYAQWKVPNALKEDIDTQNRLFFGSKGAHWKYEHHRICWDAFTSSGDFIISPHAGAQGLYVATCGSFHGYKFFPVLGKYVVQMLEDKLEPELKEKWAWDRERPDGAFNCEFPNSELKDLLDPAARL